MSRSRSSNLSAQAQRELDAIDGALAERPVAAEHDALARFARELRASRPQADEQFLATLDARAAQGFELPGAGRAASSSRPRRARGRARAPWARPKLRGLTARPALGLALAALLALAVALPIALRGGGHARHAVVAAPVATGAAA